MGIWYIFNILALIKYTIINIMLTNVFYLIAPYGANVDINGLHYFALLYHKQDIFRGFYTMTDLQPQVQTKWQLLFS